MSNFEVIFKKAQEVKIENDKVDQERKKSKKIYEAKEKIKVAGEYKTNDYRKNNCSDELLNLIDKYNFKINSYIRNADFDGGFYSELLETYYCEFNNWSFMISNYSDIDIAEGIFQVTNIKNKITGEKVEFYCDLGCRNTTDIQLEKFIKFLSFKSNSEFAENYYGEYMKLPKLLVKNGIECEVVREKYSLNSIETILKIDKNVYLGFGTDYKDHVFINLTDNLNYLKGRSIHGDLIYSFEYKGEEDVEELIKCIKCFIEHVEGKVGYFEFGKYFGNREVQRYIDKFINSVKNSNDGYEKWNHYLFKLGSVHDDDFFLESHKKKINKYHGVEIYKKYELVFNEHSQWSIGDKANKSIITIEYNTKEDKENCILDIKNYIYTRMDEDTNLYIYDDCDEDDDYYQQEVLNDEYMTANVIEKGSFSYIMNKLKDYIENMCKIYEVPF